MSNNMDRLHDGVERHRDDRHHSSSNRDGSRDNRDGHHSSSNRDRHTSSNADGHHSSSNREGHHSSSSNRADGHYSSSSNRHVESRQILILQPLLPFNSCSSRAKTSCSAPAQSRSPSAHRSRSVSQALRQAGSPVTINTGFSCSNCCSTPFTCLFSCLTSISPPFPLVGLQPTDKQAVDSKITPQTSNIGLVLELPYLRYGMLLAAIISCCSYFCSSCSCSC